MQDSVIHIHLISYRLKKEKPLPAGNGLVENVMRIFSTCSLRWNYPDQVPSLPHVLKIFKKMMDVCQD
jgi:hypothetical protein